MARIFDNADEKFEEGLHAILTNTGVERADFCTGYFNLRGSSRGYCRFRITDLRRIRKC